MHGSRFVPPSQVHGFYGWSGHSSSQEEEAARLAAEEEARKAEEAERRKADRLARRAEAKRQGLILTGKAKREAERLAAMREQILKNAAVDGAAANGAHYRLSLPCCMLRCMPPTKSLPFMQSTC